MGKHYVQYKLCSALFYVEKLTLDFRLEQLGCLDSVLQVCVNVNCINSVQKYLLVLGMSFGNINTEDDK